MRDPNKPPQHLTGWVCLGWGVSGSAAPPPKNSHPSPWVGPGHLHVASAWVRGSPGPWGLRGHGCASPSAGFIPARDSDPCLKSVSACPRSRLFPAPAPRAWPAPALPRAGGKQPEQNVPKGPSLAGPAAKVTAGGTCGAPGPCRGDGCGSPSGLSPAVPRWHRCLSPARGLPAALSPAQGKLRVSRLRWQRLAPARPPLSRREVGSRKRGPAWDKGPVYINRFVVEPAPTLAQRLRGGPGRREGWGAVGTPAWGARRGSGGPCTPCMLAGRDGGLPGGCTPWLPLAQVGSCGRTLPCGHALAPSAVPNGLLALPGCPRSRVGSGITGSVALGIAAHRSPRVCCLPRCCRVLTPQRLGPGAGRDGANQ